MYNQWHYKILFTSSCFTLALTLFTEPTPGDWSIHSCLPELLYIVKTCGPNQYCKGNAYHQLACEIFGVISMSEGLLVLENDGKKTMNMSK